MPKNVRHVGPFVLWGAIGAPMPEMVYSACSRIVDALTEREGGS